MKRVRAAALLACLAALLLPSCAWAWGENAQKLIANKAIDTLPAEIRGFFEANRSYIMQHVVEPTEAMAKNPAERRNHFVMLNHYGRFPFDSMPRNYDAAVRKFKKATVEMYGLLPWQIGVYSEKLTEAMKAGRWDEARLLAAQLANYVAEAHDPFNTTDNSDGKLTNQPGVNLRFGKSLVDRFATFFPVRPNDAGLIADPTDHAFEECLSSHAWLQNILLADRRARAGLNDYTDEYYDRLYNQAGAVVIRQLSDAATDVGSYWLTAWNNAGRPALPSR